MNKITLTLLGVVLVAVFGGLVFLATWDIPSPSTKVEKVIPDDRFPR